jgi:hypothetical protein
MYGKYNAALSPICWFVTGGRGEALATTIYESPPKSILANASPYAQFYYLDNFFGGLLIMVCWRGLGRSMTQFKLSVIP